MLTIWTYDWVPGGSKGPRGFVRDLRLRWACEEAGLDYCVKSTPFENRGPDHYKRQPFGQIPFLDDDGVTIFESGACLLHLAGKSAVLMPSERAAAAETLQWTIAALNSIEMVSVPWFFLGGAKQPDNPLSEWLDKRLTHTEGVLASREWIAAGRFTVADIIMADVLRQTFAVGMPKRPVSQEYIDRVCGRPAFQKAYADQVAYFTAADEARST